MKLERFNKLIGEIEGTKEGIVLDLDKDLIRDIDLFKDNNFRCVKAIESYRENMELILRKGNFDAHKSMFGFVNMVEKVILPAYNEEYGVKMRLSAYEKISLADRLLEESDLDYSLVGVYYTKARFDKEFKENVYNNLSPITKKDKTTIRTLYNEMLDYFNKEGYLMDKQANSWVCPSSLIK